MTEWKIGCQAPDFDAIATDGSLFSFEKHQKEHDCWHLLVFFRGSWCPICQSMLKDFNEARTRFKEKNTHVIAISSDNLTSLKEMVEQYKLEFPVLSDKDAVSAKRYGVMIHKEDAPYEDHEEHNDPAAFLVDDNGRVLYLYKQTGPFGRPSVQAIEKTINYIKRSLK